MQQLRNNYRLPQIIGITLFVICLIGLLLPIRHVASAGNKPAATANALPRVGRPRAPTDISKVAIGSSFMLGVLQNQTLVSWGDNRQW